MAKPLKTQPTDTDVDDYIANLDSEQQREDCKVLLKLMKKITKAKPVLWGNSIIGYGQYHYESKSGQKGDWPLTGFAARKQNLTVYIMQGFEPYADLMSKIGKTKNAKSCLYIKKLADIDLTVLEELITNSVNYMHATYETTVK